MPGHAGHARRGGGTAARADADARRRRRRLRRTGCRAPVTRGERRARRQHGGREDGSEQGDRIDRTSRNPLCLLTDRERTPPRTTRRLYVRPARPRNADGSGRVEHQRSVTRVTADKGTSRAISRILSRAPGTGARGRPSISGCRCRRPPRGALPPGRNAVGCGLPGSSGGQPSSAPCLALLRVGFTEPRRSPGALVVSYTTVSPLPGRPDRRRRSVLCGTVPRVTPGGRYPPPCPVESGLSSAGARPPDAAACPARPPSPHRYPVLKDSSRRSRNFRAGIRAGARSGHCPSSTSADARRGPHPLPEPQLAARKAQAPRARRAAPCPPCG